MSNCETKRRVLITGCSRGIGLALAEHFLAADSLVIGCSRSLPPIDSDHFCHFALDLNDADAVTAMMRTVRKEHGGLDVLINNAGVASMAPVALQPPQIARNVVELNLNSMVSITHSAIRLLRSGTNPRIVNFSTVAVPYRLEGEAIYSATKAAIEQWSRVLAKELGPMGITVNVVGPTPVRTDLIRGIAEEKLEALIARQAIPRWGTVEDVINVIDFFVDPRSDFVTGQVLYLGGAG
ncbi:SDR family NAD(P)-dependent oxidoreductase [Novipirellula artificiosorum]|uniref:3-oxoacyl-[acyl-carrier-protein] reductase FabG n=1 Tax=Novipirellula artificiosorum TaxID=2528016 RepID=A0A5C6DR58_9BACT|nr:SDR family oxidoreductase [Novipirellula artificiosorum]TWU39763.1 3-oxoacyl-[acyl-carrier-protein] reductase FabG [Novipirellula artificiosorum]